MHFVRIMPLLQLRLSYRCQALSGRASAPPCCALVQQSLLPTDNKSNVLIIILSCGKGVKVHIWSPKD